jgi:hypothetical protein
VLPVRSTGRAAALAVAALSGAATVLAVLVVTRDAAWSLPAAADVPVDAGIGLVYPAVGAALVLARHGAPRLGAVMLLAGAASAATVLATAVALVATAPTPGVQAAVWLQSWLWVPGTAPLLTLVPLLYPDGRLPSPRWWPVAAAAVLGTALAAAGVSLYPEPFRGRVVLPPGFSHEPSARALVLAGACCSAPQRWRRWPRSCSGPAAARGSGAARCWSCSWPSPCSSCTRCSWARYRHRGRR